MFRQMDRRTREDNGPARASEGSGRKWADSIRIIRPADPFFQLQAGSNSQDRFSPGTRAGKASEPTMELRKQLHRLAWELSAAETRQRRKISEDLHDCLGQLLFAAKIKSENLDKLTSPGEMAVAGREIAGLVNQAIKGVRSMIMSISPPSLERQGLAAALKELTDNIHRDFGIRTGFNEKGSPRRLNGDLTGLIYRSARELVWNAVKHARAEYLHLDLGWGLEEIRVVVSDNGQGFDAASVFIGQKSINGFGLPNMRDRLVSLGGGLEISSKPGQGTTGVMTVPSDTP